MVEKTNSRRKTQKTQIENNPTPENPAKQKRNNEKTIEIPAISIHPNPAVKNAENISYKKEILQSENESSINNKIELSDSQIKPLTDQKDVLNTTALNTNSVNESDKTGNKIDKKADLRKGENLEENKKTLFEKFVSIIKVIKIELLVGMLGLILTLGQYFHGSITVRISVAETWRDGYTSEVRDRMTKFRFLYKKWESDCREKAECLNDLSNSIDKLTYSSKLFTEDLGSDKYIRQLICEDFDTNNCNAPKSKKENFEAALKYRNALIEGLNTAEAVKAVVEAKPFYHWDIIYSDTLQGRYLDIISEISSDMKGFIASYRRATEGRNTVAWFVLDNHESNKGNYIVIGSCVTLLILILIIIYFLKIRYRNLRQENSPNEQIE